MHRASRIMAAFVLSLGLMACSGGGGTASTETATSTEAAASAASSSDAASTSGGGTNPENMTLAGGYTNPDLGLTYTPPDTFEALESTNPNVVYQMADMSTGDSINIIVVAGLPANEDINDPSYFEEMQQEFTNQLDASGIEGATITPGKYTLDDGTSFPAILGSGTLKDIAVDVEQVYVQKGDTLAALTATSTGATTVDEILAGLNVQ